MIIYVENFKEQQQPKTLQKLISNSSKVAGYQVNMQISCFPIYQQWTIEIWNKNYNIIYIRERKKILRYKFNKIHIQDLDEENYQTLIK